MRGALHNPGRGYNLAMQKKITRMDKLRALSELTPYPAVFWPQPEGGLEVIFTNIPGLTAYGPSKAIARTAAVEMLTAHFTGLIMRGEAIPKASDPKRLHPDPDEPPGTSLEMIEADQAVLRRRLGLEKRPRGGVLSSMGTLGAKK